ncbi:MAG: UvrD-helicase domain-containing protein [Actinomycetota bacterium]
MPKSIACGHCGGTHASVAEVRSCSASPHPPSAPATNGRPPPERQPAARPGSERHSPTRAAARPSAPSPAPAISEPAMPASVPPEWQATIDELAGPDALGRGLILEPGQAVPSRWATAPEIDATGAVDDELEAELHEAWRQRERIVVRWAGPLPAGDGVLSPPFHDRRPDSHVPGDRLHLVLAHLIDARSPEAPVMELRHRALALGAKPGRGAGDVELESGEVAWVDGGPLDADVAAAVAPARLVPRIQIEAGQLNPLPASRLAPDAELAPDQLAAVAHRGGPARILAPAGSGKTRVLSERTRHLVRDWGLHASTISLVAYNRRARGEMADRLSDVRGLEIRTLNSVALAIATGREPFAPTGNGGRLQTINELDARRLLEPLVPGRRRSRNTDPLESWIDALSACRLGLRDPHEVEAAYGNEVPDFPDVLDRYRRALAERSLVDYDEQILAAIEVLATDPAARRVARRTCGVLLIDEFQDLTPAHLLLVRLASGPASEVFAVGDDDQTIYGYSGASPRWLVDFEQIFPGAADHRLTVNYRCPPAVVAGASNLLSHNRHRVAKEITAGTADASTDGPKPMRIARSTDPQAEIVRHIEGLIANGADPSSIAVLCRVHAGLLPATIHLSESGVPITRPVGVGPQMLERSGVAAALAWLRLAAAPAKRLSGDDIRAAMRRPPRSLHPRISDWACEQRSVAELESLAGRLNTERDATTVTGFANDITRLRDAHADGVAASGLLDIVADEIGLFGAASQLDQSQRSARRAAHADELHALRAVADLAPGPAELGRWLRERLDALPAPTGSLSERDPDQPPTVTLATVHTTKGLEWDHVVVHDVRGDLYPHPLAADLEEERRIFHVACTRARRSLLVNATGAAATHPVSPFLVELEQGRPADEPWPELVVSSRSRPTAGQPTAKTKAERAEPGSPEAAARRDALVDWRRSRAKEDDVPAYIVLDNATLDAIAETNPGSLITLGNVKGIGPTKLDRYGADILGVLASTGD